MHIPAGDVAPIPALPNHAVFACFEEINPGSQHAKARSLQGLSSNCSPYLALGQVSAHPGALCSVSVSVCWQQHPQLELGAAVELRKVPLQLSLGGQPLRSRRDLHSVTVSAFTLPGGDSERFTAQQSPTAARASGPATMRGAQPAQRHSVGLRTALCRL